MEDEGYMAVICAILYDNEDDEKEKAKRAELLEHLREAHALTSLKHEQLLAQCLHMLRYQLEVIAHLPPTETMVLYIFNEEICKQYVANTEEIYKFEVGDHSNFKLKFAIARFNGKSHKTIVRSGSIIKRLMQIERREEECIQISQLPVGNLVKKTISLKGHQYAVELKLLKTIDHENMPVLDFQGLLELTRALHEYDAEMMEGDYSGELSDRSFALLHRSAQFSNIPPEVIKIATLSTFLVWDTSKAILDHDSIPRLIRQLKEQQNIKKSAILDTALAHLVECVISELREVINQHNDKQLFPPEGYSILKSLNDSLRTVVDICVLPIWDLSSSDPTSILTRELRQMVQNSAKRWAEQEFLTDRQGEKDVCNIIHSMWELLHNHQSYTLFFSQFNINYVGVVLETVDERIETLTRDYLSKWLSILDSRQGDQLEKFTKYTMRLYDTLHLLTVFGKRNNVEILRVYDFEGWFSNITVFWTYSWRDISLKMVARTISLNNDGDETKYEHHRPLPGGLYSFLCIQKGLSDDYTMLAFRRPENLLMGSIALVHIYAENIYAYAKKLHADVLSSDSDTDSRTVRAVNGIEQALLFISERWRRFVNFDRLAAVVPQNEAEAISKSCLNVLESTRKRCEQIMYALLRVHSRTKREDILKIARNITVDSHEQSKSLAMYMREISPAERIHAVLDSVDRLASDVKGELLHRCSQISLEILHKRLEKQVSRQLKRCHSPDYYSEVYIMMKAIHTILDVPPETSNLTSLLHLYSFTTNELILSYYAKVVEGVHKKNDDDVPHISVQIGYMPTNGENVLILLNVVSLDGLPELNTFCNRIEPFVRIELLPTTLYPPHCFPLYKTSTLSHCEESKWNQTFQILVPQQLFYTYGSSLCMSVMDHDRICDQLVGRTFLATNQLPRIETLSVSKLPDAQQLPLVQPNDTHPQPYYKLLKERSAYDKTAKAFLKREKTAKEMYLKCITRSLSTRFRSAKKPSS